MKAHQMKIQLTQDGHDNLKLELEELMKIKRPAAVTRLSKARSMGDLAENSEYHAAKEELAFVAGRATEVETILKNAKIVSSVRTVDKISLGSKVKVKSANGAEEFEIVGEFEANPIEKKLSSTSPIGLALIGKAVGEKAEVVAPAGNKSYTVVEIK